MRRRLDLAVSLVASPPVLFLDEPTTGLDPRSRVELWDVLRELVRGGTTLLLTTQYLEEADTLADEIIVIDRGRVIAAGTPTELKDQAGRASVVLTLTHASETRAGRESDPQLRHGGPRRGGSAPPGRAGRRARRHDPDSGLLQEHRIEVDDLGLKRPSLDDVFLHLTGHRAEDEQDTDTDRRRPSAPTTPASPSARRRCDDHPHPILHRPDTHRDLRASTSRSAACSSSR